MRKACLCLVACVYCFAYEGVYNFCAFFAENANEYSIHPMSGNNLINEKYFRYKFDAPFDEVDSLSGDCAMLSGPPVNDFNFHLKNASKTLMRYYGAVLDGEVLTYRDSLSKFESTEFKFVIKGECQNEFIVAEYCADKQAKRLYKIKDLDFLPKFIFSGTGSQWCGCQKYEEQVKSFARISRNEQQKLNNIITKGCDEYILADFISVSDFTLLKDSTYNLLIENQAKIQIDSESFQKNFQFYIKINGNCR